MKKLFLIASLMMLSVGAFAQYAPGTLSCQPKVGLNIANITDSEADVRIGLVAGAEFEYQITDIFSLSAGALYSMQGCKDKESGVTNTLQLDYINIPVLANVYVSKGLAVKLGLQPGFNVSSKVSAKSGGNSVSLDASDGVKSFDLALPIGLSYQFNDFVIDGRYNFGLSKVFDGDSSKNSVFQITLGYKFAL